MTHKVLLVDDEPLVTEALVRALHRESLEVRAANSAEDAFGLLAREAIDVVVSDEMMPGMLGSDFLGVVCARYPETIRIILTGHPNLDTALRAINQGHIYRFLLKPCSGPELALTIRQGIQHRELSRKSQSLLETVKRQNTMIQTLESRYPGITTVKRDVEGAVEIADVEYDLDTLIDEIKREVEKSESYLKSGK
ncbi:MAG: response regulator [Syntrophobacteraceae bacterium]